MKRPPQPREPKPALVSKLAVLYGLVMINIGVFILFDKFTAPQLVIDTSFKAGAFCVVLGGIALVYARSLKGKS